MKLIMLPVLIDQAVGWPVRHLLKFLNASTGKDNVWLAKAAHVQAAALIITSNLTSPKKTWADYIVIAIWIIVGSRSWTTLDSLADRRRRSLGDELFIHMRSVYILAGTISFLAAVLTSDMSVSKVLGELGLITYGCVFYFIDENHPKRPGWVGKTLAALLGKQSGPSTSPA